jgi:transposase, IS30 family
MVMAQKYVHLSQEEREKLAIYRAQNFSLREISKLLGRSHSTLSRELKRNSPPVNSYYLSHKAQKRSDERISQAHKRVKLKTAAIQNFIVKEIKTGLSPELIAGRLPLKKSGCHISHEAIYQFIYSERRDLIAHLVRSHRKRQKRGHSKKHRKSHIPNRISITERPRCVENRNQLGHWEADTVVSGSGLSALMVLVERVSRTIKIGKLSRKSARRMSSSINMRLGRMPKKMRRTITYDNGSENVEHQRTNEVLGTKSYFCNPYHSWEKGSVENAAGLIRRTYPKGTDFDKISRTEIRQLEDKLNNRPRKCLAFRTPLEVI